MTCGMDLGVWALCIATNYPQSVVGAFAFPKAKLSAMVWLLAHFEGGTPQILS